MPEAETNPKGIGVFMNKIDKQIIKSIIRANTGAPENMIEFVEQLPEEHFTTPPDDYIGYRMMNTGTQLCHIGNYITGLSVNTWLLICYDDFLKNSGHFSGVLVTCSISGTPSCFSSPVPGKRP